MVQGGTTMSKTYELLAAYIIQADSEEEVWEKWAAEKDVMYDSVWSIELIEEDDDEEEDEDNG
jgi:hypothetical protein